MLRRPILISGARPGAAVGDHATPASLCEALRAWSRDHGLPTDGLIGCSHGPKCLMAEVLRMFELVQQIADELVELRRTAGDLETVKRLGQICLEKTGLPFDYVKRSAPQEVLTLLGQGGSLQPIRAVILAELLLQDSELNRDAGRIRDAIIERVQAGALIAASVDRLGLEDQERYRSKLAALMSELQHQSESVVDES